MKRRIDKIIEVIPMTRADAEARLGTSINNLMHGDNGYLVGGTKWLPAYVVEDGSLPFQTPRDRIMYFVQQINEATEWLKTKPAIKQQLTIFSKALNKLIYETDKENKLSKSS